MLLHGVGVVCRIMTVFNGLSMQDAAPRRVQMAVAGFAAAALLAAQMPVQAADVKTVVCASNPTSKICLKVSSSTASCSFTALQGSLTTANGATWSENPEQQRFCFSCRVLAAGLCKEGPATADAAEVSGAACPLQPRPQGEEHLFDSTAVGDADMFHISFYVL